LGGGAAPGVGDGRRRADASVARCAQAPAMSWGLPREAEVPAAESGPGPGDDLERLSNPCVTEAEAEDLETCCVCLDSLSCEAITPLLASEGPALQPACCRHFCHLRCAMRLRPQRCPVCRLPFQSLRRVTRAGLLRMTAAELQVSLRRLYGVANTTSALGLVVAAFPIPAATAARRFEQLGAYPLSEEGLAKVLRHLSKYSSSDAVPRPLSYYQGEDVDSYDRATVARRKIRRIALRLCGALGGACHGMAVGGVAGVICGGALRRPPRIDDVVEMSRLGRMGFRIRHTQEAPGARFHWVDLLDHLLDSLHRLAPWHIFGSAFLAAVLAIVVACLTVLLLKCFIATGRATALLGRMAHRALWVWMVASLGAGATDEEVGRWVWRYCVSVCTVVGALLGSAHAVAVVDSSGSRFAGAFWRAATGSFSSGVRAGCRLWVSRRRRLEAERFGDGSLSLMQD